MPTLTESGSPTYNGDSVNLDTPGPTGFALQLLACWRTPSADRTDWAHSSSSNRGIGTMKRPPHARTYESCSTISLVRFHGRMRM
jgi:hypothetical protein